MLTSFSASTFRGLTGLLALLLLLGACQTETTSDQQQTNPLPEGELEIEDPWLRPASAGDTTAFYMTVANGNSSPDTLVGARQAPIYESVQIFGPASAASIRPQPVDSLIIPANKRTHLAPDSAHVTLNNLNQPLKEGESLLVTMDFAQSGLQQVQAEVRTSPPSDEP